MGNAPGQGDRPPTVLSICIDIIQNYFKRVASVLTGVQY